MIGLDTNVLVRFLAQDDPSQSKKANAIIEKELAKGRNIFINHIVLCELVWVLGRAYRLQKQEIVNTLEKILMAKQFEIEAKDLVWRAATEFKTGRADFSDSLIGIKNQSAGCTKTITFDKEAANLRNFDLA